jgi:DNA repair ATPase RecN
LVNLPLEQAVAQLNSSLSKAQTDAARLEDLKNRLGKQEKILREAEETIKIALKQLDSLCMNVGCARHEDLEEIERKSSLKKSIQEKIDSTETRLLGAGGGCPSKSLLKRQKVLMLIHCRG